MRALLLRKGKKEVDRREGREEEGICRTNGKVLPTPLVLLLYGIAYRLLLTFHHCLLLSIRYKMSIFQHQSGVVRFVLCFYYCVSFFVLMRSCQCRPGLSVQPTYYSCVASLAKTNTYVDTYISCRVFHSRFFSAPKITERR